MTAARTARRLCYAAGVALSFDPVRILSQAAALQRLRVSNPEMFDGAKAAASINKAIADYEQERTAA